MLGDLEEIDDTAKTRAARQLGGDVGERYFKYPRHFDLPGRECVAPPHFHMRPLPHTNGRRDLAPPDAVAQAAQELHGSPGV